MFKFIAVLILILSFPIISFAADLAITKTASSTTVSPGEQITYTINIANKGPDTATNVKMSDRIYRATYASHSVSQGSCRAGGTLICDLGAIEAGGSATIELVVSIGNAKSKTKFSNTASVISPNDPNRRNNKSTVKMQFN